MPPGFRIGHWEKVNGLGISWANDKTSGVHTAKSFSHILPWKPVSTLPIRLFELRLNLLWRPNTWTASCQALFLASLFSLERNNDHSSIRFLITRPCYATAASQEQTSLKALPASFLALCFPILFPLHFFGPLMICFLSLCLGNWIGFWGQF